MRCKFTGRTQKPSNSHLSGKTHHLHTQKAGEVCSNVKSMHTVSSDICKVVHYRSIQ